jgi:hypothetical protein
MAKPAPASSPSEPAAASTPVADPIPPASPYYPKYVVEFSGPPLKAPIKVTGPHTFALLQPGGGSITVSLSRNPADTGRPNLSITFS